MSKYKITGIIYIHIGMNGRERERSKSKTLILKDSSVRSTWTYLTASLCYTTNTNKHDYTTNRYYKHEISKRGGGRRADSQTERTNGL